jgi:hypothetical protein
MAHGDQITPPILPNPLRLVAGPSALPSLARIAMFAKQTLHQNSTETLFLMLATNSDAITHSADSPTTGRALSFSASTS